MSMIEVTEELVSEVDINLDLNEVGLHASVYVDEVEISSMIDWRDVGLTVVDDTNTYSNARAKAIAKKMRIVSDYILDELKNGRE